MVSYATTIFVSIKLHSINIYMLQYCPYFSILLHIFQMFYLLTKTTWLKQSLRK